LRADVPICHRSIARWVIASHCDRGRRLNDVIGQGAELGMLIATEADMPSSTTVYRRLRSLKITAEVLAGLGAVWLAINVYPYDAPAPRWTERDRPIPGVFDNGWYAVTSEQLDVEIPKSLASLVDSREQDAGEFWALVEQDTDALHELMASEGAREARARIDDARRQPEFVDACVLREPCLVFAWHRAHDVALLQTLTLAHAGRTTEALTRVRELIRMDASQLASARSLVSLLVALDQLGDALHKAEMIAAGVEAQGLAELEIEVRALDVDALDLRTLVVSEYLVRAQVLQDLDAIEKTHELSTRPRWLYSEALTLRVLDEAFAQRYEAAIAGDVLTALGGDERSPRESSGWWLRNPVGKRLLDAMVYDPTEIAGSIDESLEDIQATRTRLLARVR
jgi:hypothetical protein